ncbi:MAG: DNA-directed RNA polymerase subunit beta [Phycisphaerae bacterium]
MIVPSTIRSFGKVGDALPIPDLIRIQRQAYERFLQETVDPAKRKNEGLENLLHETFPIESYAGDVKLTYVDYELGKPRYTPDECRELKLTYGKPLRVRIRLTRKESGETIEEGIYLGDIPIMLGGGEFIINGATRVIVSQLHRSPGVDFVVESQQADRPLHAARVIPERGSWIEINVTKRELIAVRIDQSSKMPATTFLRALDAKYSSDIDIIKAFYKTKSMSTGQLKAGMVAAEPIVDPETGEELLAAGAQIAEALSKIQASSVKQVEIIEKVSDPLILNTMTEDTSRSHEEALLKIYTRLRPGNPPQLEKAKKLFHEKFFDPARYRLGRVGRFRINRKFNQNIDLNEMVLRPEDFVGALKYIMALRAGEGYIDDIDHLGNRRLRTIDELAVEELRKGLLKLRRTVQERISIKAPSELNRISEVINSKAVGSAIEYFFGRGELSQVVDQTNPLSQLTHERRLSALGPGGLNRKRAGFEVRDVHISHYGRICPIETPEGTNIGLISSLAVYSGIDEYGFLITPYRQVERGKVNGKLVHLRADEEMNAIIAPPHILKDNKLPDEMVLARAKGDLSKVNAKDVQYIDISPKQIVGISAALIPFLEHDDANRALMGSNMQRQAVPLLRTEPPIVGTGMETYVALNSGMVVTAKQSGVVTSVDATHIILNDTDEYELAKFKGLNERTCLNQKPIVKVGQKVKAGQIIADGPATSQGELALGRNLLVAFMPFDGYNFEDAILISEKLLHEDGYTSLHIDEFEIEVRETKLGREEFTRDIPNVSEKALRNLDERGIVSIGTPVTPGDILVGKVSPKSKTELTPEEKLLQAIFGRAGEDVKNDSLEVPAGIEGIVIGAKHFARRTALSEAQKKALKTEMAEFKSKCNAKMIRVFKQLIDEINELTSQPLVDPNTRQKVAASESDDVVIEQIDTFNIHWVKPASIRDQAQKIIDKYWPKILEARELIELKTAQMKRGDELPSGVLEMVKIYIAAKRVLSVGDKMAGRHGNKGVIARIMPIEDMPYLADGIPVDIVLNPLGVPSRMNVGQILETHLGWAAGTLGFRAVTPVFDGAREEEIQQCLKDAGLPEEGKTTLHDGRTGEPFSEKVTVGFLYMMKLHHLVDDKIHARSTGPYSLITQQPLGGKARTGGQRFGEMEVWGLEAYGAAYILQEMLTVKSDDVEGRTKIYESMVKGANALEAGTPVSFEVLCNEIRGLALNVQLEKRRLI